MTIHIKLQTILRTNRPTVAKNKVPCNGFVPLPMSLFHQVWWKFTDRCIMMMMMMMMISGVRKYPKVPYLLMSTTGKMIPDPHPLAYQHQDWTISEATNFIHAYKVLSTLIYAHRHTDTHTHTQVITIPSPPLRSYRSEWVSESSFLTAHEHKKAI